MMDQLGRAYVFSKIDLRSRYYRFRVNIEDIHKLHLEPGMIIMNIKLCMIIMNIKLCLLCDQCSYSSHGFYEQKISSIFKSFCSCFI